MRRFMFRPAAVVFGASGSASARPSGVRRPGLSMDWPMILEASAARAAESWKLEGKRTVRIG